jgi:hypothetical protein
MIGVILLLLELFKEEVYDLKQKHTKKTRTKKAIRTSKKHSTKKLSKKKDKK